MMVTHLDLLHLSSEPLGESGLKEGAVGVLREYKTKKRTTCRKTLTAQPPERKER
jgi:hypothetical protein